MSYVQKVKENSAAMLDHLEIQLKPDMDSILRCSRLEAWDPTAAVSMEGGANFPEGTGNIESVTIVQRSEKRPDKVFCAMLSVTVKVGEIVLQNRTELHVETHLWDRI
jgi:hypothetical protein